MRFNLDVSKLKQDIGQQLQASDTGDTQKLTPDLAKLRNPAPGLDDLKNILSPDTDKLQKLSLALKDVQNRIPGVEDISSLTRRGGSIQKLVPFWGGGDETESNSEDRAIVALSESKEKEKYKKAQKVLDAPQSKATLQNEIENLGDAAVTIKLSFERVANALVDARKTAETPEQADDLSSFGETWSKHQQEWVTLLQMSQKVAGRARLTTANFVESFLKVLADATVSLDAKKEKIKAYQDKLKVGMNESRDLAQGFVDLQTCIGSFYKRVMDWMKQRNKIKEDILQLVADIKTTKEYIQNAASALGLETLAAGAIALGILCPLLWVGAAFSGIRAVQAGKTFLDMLSKKNKNVDEIQRKRNDLDAKLLDLEGLKRIQVILEPALSDLSVIGNKLWVISHIWSFIHADIVGIEKSLDTAGKGAREALFKARLKTVTSIYSLLGEALSQYETAVKAVALGDEN
ncbi:hypothetical protein BKA82DRAFT_4187742 [Pisolithus tinctorius]|nr:hypothetical protein BKA82DRAFT_4187742 [Pisolithus tinctorius]